MIERYTTSEMKKIWELESKFKYFLSVELAVCKAYNKLGKIPDIALTEIEKKANFDLARIEELEAEVHHDVIAFLTCVNEYVGSDYSHYIHMGLTSSDVIDTAFALQIKDSAALIFEELTKTTETVKKLAKKYKNTPCLGRSHGIGAEVITFGFKFLNLLDMLERAEKRLKDALDEISVGMLSGPCGTYSNIDPKIEELTCEYLGLKPAKISTQVISRDRHSYILHALALIATVIESFSLELRHLQRWEVAEVEEGFSKGQKGSSAMPHKKNPISGENLCGLARVVKSNAIATLDNIALWHERDISHSSVERVVFPDSFILTHYMLKRFEKLLANLNVKEANMIENIEKYGGIIYSQGALLALCNKGNTREEAYKIVQKEAFEAYNNKQNFKDNMAKYLTEAELSEVFNQEKYLNNIDKIYERFNLS